MRDTNLVGHVSNILFSRNSDKPWMTATGLSQRLEEVYGCTIEPAKIESTLEEYSRKPGRKIRYSYYPMKKTLDILWGHVNNVGDVNNLPALDRLDEPVEYAASSVKEDATWFFISHNHRDLERVIELREQLIENGYGVWIFETEIPQYGRIPDSVGEAIQNCEYFISYVSARSIGSLWVQKEVEVASKPYVFLDGEDVKLCNLFGNWRNAWPPDLSLAKEFCRTSANRVGRSNDPRWLCRCEEFMEELDDYLLRTNRVVAFPSLKNRDYWKSETLELEGLCEFLKRIKEGED